MKISKEVKVILKELKKAVELDLDKLNKTKYIDEELYTVSRNKILKKSLINYGKDLLEFVKNHVDFCNRNLEEGDVRVHDIVLHKGELYWIYESDKDYIENIFDENGDDYLNTDQVSHRVVVNCELGGYFIDEEGDTCSELSYEYFQNAENVMKKYFF